MPRRMEIQDATVCYRNLLPGKEAKARALYVYNTTQQVGNPSRSDSFLLSIEIRLVPGKLQCRPRRDMEGTISASSCDSQPLTSDVNYYFYFFLSLTP